MKITPLLVRISKFTGFCLMLFYLFGFQKKPAKKSATDKKLNIIMILADDLGYGDLGCYGNKNIFTPNLNKLAASGLRFTQFYSASAVCTPTRASILTGRYPYRFGISNVFFDREEHLPKDELLLPALLRSAGYKTAHIGKWHLGGLNTKHTQDRETFPFGPKQMGFDYSYVMFEDRALRSVIYQEKRIYKDGAKYYMRNDTLMPPSDKHMTDFETDQVLSTLNTLSNKSEPFFINFCPFNQHLPLEATPDEFMKMYTGKAEGDELLYRAMLSHLDASVGRIMAKVKDLGIEENTLIIFTSDNGPANLGSVGALKGRKFDLYEGGIKVPAIMTWPGRIKANSVTHTFGHSTDLLKTICEATETPLPANLKFDGVSLIPLFDSKTPNIRNTVFWQMDVLNVKLANRNKPEPFASEVARSGQWKLLALKGEPVALYDLEKDPNEKTNLLTIEKKIAERLFNELQFWKKECENEKTFKNRGVPDIQKRSH